MIRRPPRSTLFPTRRSSDLAAERYSAAVVLFEMATGRTPVYGDGLSDPAAVQDEAAVSESLFDPSDRKSTRLNSSHANISYAVFCLKKKNTIDSIPYPA